MDTIFNDIEHGLYEFISHLNKRKLAEVSSLVYTAAPYTVKDEAGKEDFEEVCKRMDIFFECETKLAQREIQTVSPLYKHFLRKKNIDLPGDWEYWSKYSETLLVSSDVLLIVKIPGWEMSEGVRGEVLIARNRRIPTFAIYPEELGNLR